MILKGDITIPYKWTTGPVIGRFLAELRDNARIVGARCAKCNKVFVPPTDVCGQCFKPLDAWVELTGEGKIIAVSAVHYQLPWSPVPPPYALALVRLDGADTDMIHIAQEGLKAGDRVRAKFKEERSGTILDIDKFVPISDVTGKREAITVQPLKEVRGQVSLPYRWSYGKALTRFFQESRDNKRLMGTRCPRCSSVTVPAARICTRCFVETTDWVEVSDHGVLETFTTVHLPFPGQPTEPPYTYGLILLDGASTYFSHLIEEPAEALRCGMRVEAVWSDERKGDLFDILYFRKEES